MTARQKLDAQELREELFRASGYYCAHCGGSLLAHGTPQLAHRIAQSKANIKKYGPAIIHHRLNLVPVCQIEPCNSAMNIGNNPGEIQELLEQIEEENGRH